VIGFAVAKSVDWVVRQQLQQAMERIRDTLESAAP
jgi:hypothetical protein